MVATATATALLAAATTALVTTATVMSHVGGDLGDDDSDVVAVSKLRNGVPKVLTIPVDAPPPSPVESFNMASACGGVVFGSPTPGSL